MKNSTKRNALWNAVGTTFNAFNSLFFMMIVTRTCGIVDAGIFTFAFSTATLLNVIGVYSGRVYQVTDTSESSDRDFLVNKIITCSIMLFIGMIFVIIKRYDITKSLVIIVLCLLKCFEAFCEVFYAYFQKQEMLYKVGISFTIKSCIGLVVFLLANLITKNVLISCILLLLSYIIVMLLYDVTNLKHLKLKKTYSFNNVLSILKTGLYPFIITFSCLFIINAAKYVIDLKLLESDQTIYGIIIMPATVILLFGQFIIHPYLTKIINYYRSEDYGRIKKLIYNFILFMIITGGISSICAWLFGVQILGLLYGIALDKYRMWLLLVMIGASFYGITSILSNILIAIHKFKAQTVVLLITSIMTYIVAFCLISYYGLKGAFLAYFFTMLLLCIVFVIMTLYYLSIRKVGLSDE